MKQLSELKIFFMGTPQLAQDILRYLVANNVPIHTVVTQPDRPFGRKKELRPSEVKVFAKQHGMPVAQFEKIDDAAMEFFQNQRPDLIIVAAYGIILPKALVQLPAYGCVNVHMSLLPALRGASPIQTALWLGLEQTGTTVMLMDEKMDTGDILSQKTVAIDEQDTADTLAAKLVDASNEILLPTLQQWINQEITPQRQDHDQATYAKIIRKEDGRIDWTKPARDIFHQHQALYKWPKIYTFWNQPEPKKIILHDISYDMTGRLPKHQPGEVFHAQDNIVAIQTGQGVVIPHILQLEGKNPVLIQSFLNGYPAFIGAVLH